MLHIFNITERPSTAKQIASILSCGNHQIVQSLSKFNPIYEFEHEFQAQKSIMYFTSVSGHLMNIDFPEEYHRWTETLPEKLFRAAPVICTIKPDKEILVKNLIKQAQKCQVLILWLAHGVNEEKSITFEIMDLCKEMHPSIQVYHANLTNLSKIEIENVLERLTQPEKSLRDALQALCEVDLRISMGITRFQTQYLQERYREFKTRLISFDSCEFPILGFVVEKWKQREEFETQRFWYISLKYEDKTLTNPKQIIEFKWHRKRLFDHDSTIILYEKCLQVSEARVISINDKKRSFCRPMPLSSIELQKLASLKFHMSCDRVMNIAQKLYDKGFISFPYSETDYFSSNIDLIALIQIHCKHPEWGNYAIELLNQNKFQWPCSGGHDDGAHPPIHPVKLFDKSQMNLTIDECRVYELISRHFLACCSKDAVAIETTVIVQIVQEGFYVVGLTINERNWLDIYHPYQPWITSKILPAFTVGQSFIPSELSIVESKTSVSSLFTGAELISLMKKSGIGGYKARHEYINKLKEKQYIEEIAGNIRPTKLGMALIRAYEELQIELYKPDLRAEIERNVKEIAQGKLSKDAFMDDYLNRIGGIYQKMKQVSEKLFNSIGAFFLMASGNKLSSGFTKGNLEGFFGVDLKEYQVISKNEGICGKCEQKSSRIMESKSGWKVMACEACSLIMKIPKGSCCFASGVCLICSFQALEYENQNQAKRTICPYCLQYPSDGLLNRKGNNHMVTVANVSLPTTNQSLYTGGSNLACLVMKCLMCKQDHMMLTNSKKEVFIVTCKNFSSCKNTIIFPESVKSIEVSNKSCEVCGHDVKKLKILFAIDEKFPNDLKARLKTKGNEFCIGGCSDELKSIGVAIKSSTANTKSSDSAVQITKQPSIRSHIAMAKSPPSSLTNKNMGKDSTNKNESRARLSCVNNPIMNGSSSTTNDIHIKSIQGEQGKDDSEATTIRLFSVSNIPDQAKTPVNEINHKRPDLMENPSRSRRTFKSNLNIQKLKLEADSASSNNNRNINPSHNRQGLIDIHEKPREVPQRPNNAFKGLSHTFQQLRNAPQKSSDIFQRQVISLDRPRDISQESRDTFQVSNISLKESKNPLHEPDTTPSILLSSKSPATKKLLPDPSSLKKPYQPVYKTLNNEFKSRTEGKICNRCKKAGHNLDNCPFDIPVDLSPCVKSVNSLEASTMNTPKRVSIHGIERNRYVNTTLSKAALVSRNDAQDRSASVLNNSNHVKTPKKLSANMEISFRTANNLLVYAKNTTTINKRLHSSRDNPSYNHTSNNDLSRIRCYKCGIKGHYANKCLSASSFEEREYYSGDDNPGQINQITCYKCHKPGHFARSCTFASTTNQHMLTSKGFNPNQRIYNWSENKLTQDKKYTCYKCNQPGHWANSCPNGPIRSSNSFGFANTKEYGSTTTSKIICYKCKEPGHIAPKCPNINYLNKEEGEFEYNPERLPNNRKRKFYDFQANSMVDNKTCLGCGNIGDHPKASKCPYNQKKKLKWCGKLTKGLSFDQGEIF